jgi:hypothetical protein
VNVSLSYIAEPGNVKLGLAGRQAPFNQISPLIEDWNVDMKIIDLKWNRQLPPESI